MLYATIRKKRIGEKIGGRVVEKVGDRVGEITDNNGASVINTTENQGKNYGDNA